MLDEVCKEVLRKQLWQVSEYCGVEVVTYTILSNHFHVLVRVPQKEPVSDDELVRRYRVLYPRPTRYQTARLEVVIAQLKTNGPEGQAWRKRQLALMGDLSPFMKLVKQRFSIWFNKSHERFGTLWAERFKSVLVEHHGRALEAMAAYIDLNGVRAGLCTDPKENRFCGYAEAVGGNERARQGIMRVVGKSGWESAQASYRQMLFAKGACCEDGEGRISVEQFQEVMKAGGKLPLATALRCRVRYFNDGAVLGSRAFVEAHLEVYRKKMGRRLRTAVRPMPNDVTNWGGLATLRALRQGALTVPTG